MLTVTVAFDEGVPSSAQGPALLDLEENLRLATGLDIRVFKAKMGDDSKLRSLLTPEERNKV